MPVLTPATRNFLCVLLSFKSNILVRSTISREEFYCKFFPGSYQQHRRETIKKLWNRISRTVKLKVQKSYDGIFIFILFTLRNYYLWDVNQFVERWNSPVKWIPRNEYRFMIFHDAYCWLDTMKGKSPNSYTDSVLLNERDPFCRCQVSGLSVSGRQIFPREAVC